MNHIARLSASALAITLAFAASTAEGSPAQEGSATTPLQLDAQKIKGAVRDAGVYHIATGTWTRTPGATANFGPDIIYNNSYSSSYFSPAGLAGGFSPGAKLIDEGALPTSLNSNYPNANRDSYSVNCIELGYCDLGFPGTGGWELTFYSDYEPCTFDPNPDATVTIGGLPAGGCWTIAVDLSGGGEFCLAGDGGDLSSASPTRFFGWGVEYIGTDGTAPAGLFLAGNPAATDPTFIPGGLPTDGTGTYYGPASLCSSGSTGLYTQDFLWLEDPAGTSSNCYFFGSYINNTSCVGPFRPYSSYQIEIQADTSICATSPGPFEYCQSNPSSIGTNSTIEITGSASIAANNMTLTATLPPNTFGFFITSQTQGFVANPGGSVGNICLAGDLGRFVGPGQVKNSFANGEISLSTAVGEWSLSSIPAGMGPYAAVAGLETNFQLWHRDITPTGLGSNFTNGYSVTWMD
jgi:hypothetical protein